MFWSRWIATIGLLALGGCAAPAPTPGLCVEYGLASWYRPAAERVRTADGERPRPDALTAAHPFLPFGTPVRVTDLETGRSVTVRIDDRGPFVRGRIIDLSAAAAGRLGMRRGGIARVRLLAAPGHAGSVRFGTAPTDPPRCARGMHMSDAGSALVSQRRPARAVERMVAAGGFEPPTKGL